MPTQIISYNVNGLRAALNKGFADWLKKASPDIICLQEIKAGPAQINIPLFEHLGYNCYIHSAEKLGYSGVAIFSKNKINNILAGIGNNTYDSEGRLLMADFGEWTLINIYIPSGTTGDIRQDFKMKFLDDFRNFILKIKNKRDKLLICGDYNICHKPIDINNPQKHLKSSGFLPEEREWFDRFITDGFVDTFRIFNNNPNQYSWWSYRANSRVKNLGWRIDYHLVTESLKSHVKNASILSDIEHSDHCPVSIILDI
jgi:exodeoxyribonuclease-3